MPATRLSKGPTSKDDRFRDEKHAMAHLTRSPKGRRIRSDDEISALVQLATNGWSTARAVQTAFRIQSLQKQLNDLLDNYSRPVLKHHPNDLLQGLLRTGHESASYVEGFLGPMNSRTQRNAATKAFEAFLKANPMVKKNRSLLGGEKTLVAIFVLVGAKELGIKPVIEPKELEALVQIGGIRLPETEFIGDPQPLRVRRLNWKSMIKDITTKKLPHLSKLRVKSADV